MQNIYSQTALVLVYMAGPVKIALLLLTGGKQHSLTNYEKMFRLTQEKK